MATPKSRNKPLPRHVGFYASVAAGLVAAGIVAFLQPQFAVVIGANVFFAAYLVLTFSQLRRLESSYLRAHADQEDAPAPFILIVMVASVVASAASLFFALAGAPDVDLAGIALGAASVFLGWFAVHTMWAMHYAFEYYQAPEASPGKGKKGEIVGGLDFPGGDAPDGTAFLYFAYVIGMTAQTSDTDVTSNAMRRIVTMHAVFSFFFNTLIVAAAVNIVVSLGS